MQRAIVAARFGLELKVAIASGCFILGTSEIKLEIPVAGNAGGARPVPGGLRRHQRRRLRFARDLLSAGRDEQRTRAGDHRRAAWLHPNRPNNSLKPANSMRFPFALTAKIAGHIVKHKLRKTPKFAMVLQLEPLHTCNLTCTGCGRIREYSTSLKDMVPLEECLAAADGMRRADGLHLRRRTADLSEDRGTDRRPAATGPHRLCLHQRHVHAQKDEGLSRRHLFAGSRAEAEEIARPEIDFRKGRRNHPQGRRRGAPKTGHPPDANGCIGTSTWTAWNSRTT